MIEKKKSHINNFGREAMFLKGFHYKFFVGLLIIYLSFSAVASAQSLLPSFSQGPNFFSAGSNVTAYNPYDSWAGWYLGGYYGYNSPDYNINVIDKLKEGSTLAGLLLGYNDQHNAFIYGLELAILYNKDKNNFFALPKDEFLLGSLRSRFGADLGPLMPYFSMGFGFDNSRQISPHIPLGPVAALGLDLKITRFLVLRAEAQYTDYSLIYKEKNFAINDNSYKSNLIHFGFIWRF